MTDTVPLDTVLRTPDGEPFTLAEALTHDLTIVQLVRHFGCLPCQEWLIQLDGRRSELASAGIGTLAVGGSADYQAQWLAEERGVATTLLLDPTHVLRAHTDLLEPLGWRMADPRGAVAYARTLSHGFKPQAVTRDTVRSPAVLILDREGGVRWRFEGTRIGHYPPVAEVEEKARGLL